jgi:hypothetical protein
LRWGYTRIEDLSDQIVFPVEIHLDVGEKELLKLGVERLKNSAQAVSQGADI